MEGLLFEYFSPIFLFSILCSSFRDPLPKWNVVWWLLYKFNLEVTVTLYMCSKTPCSWLNCHWWGHFQNTRWLMARSLFIANCSQLFETELRMEINQNLRRGGWWGRGLPSLSRGSPWWSQGGEGICGPSGFLGSGKLSLLMDHGLWTWPWLVENIQHLGFSPMGSSSTFSLFFLRPCDAIVRHKNTFYHKRPPARPAVVDATALWSLLTLSLR